MNERKIVDYCIASGCTMHILQSRVLDLIEESYHLIGGAFMGIDSPSESINNFYQAMVKYED